MTVAFRDMYNAPLAVGDWVALAGESGQGSAGFRFSKIVGYTKDNKKLRIHSYRRFWTGAKAYGWGHCAAYCGDPHHHVWKVPFSTLPNCLQNHLTTEPIV